MCSIPIAEGRRGGRRQRFFWRDAESRSRSRSPEFLNGRGGEIREARSELGTDILLDWAWGSLKSKRARELAHSAILDQRALLRGLGLDENAVNPALLALAELGIWRT